MGRRTAIKVMNAIFWIAVERIDDGSSIAMADLANLTPEKRLGQWTS
ncbi:hypothetical protein [Lysinibacillus fusiformis]|nr:hypothetical protein [Lysinibacillus fusiformis]